MVYDVRTSLGFASYSVDYDDKLVRLRYPVHPSYVQDVFNVFANLLLYVIPFFFFFWLVPDTFPWLFPVVVRDVAGRIIVWYVLCAFFVSFFRWRWVYFLAVYPTRWIFGLMREVVVEAPFFGKKLVFDRVDNVFTEWILFGDCKELISRVDMVCVSHQGDAFHGHEWRLEFVFRSVPVSGRVVLRCTRRWEREGVPLVGRFVD